MVRTFPLRGLLQDTGVRLSKPVCLDVTVWLAQVARALDREIQVLFSLSGRKTVSERELQAAVRLLLPSAT